MAKKRRVKMKDKDATELDWLLAECFTKMVLGDTHQFTGRPKKKGRLAVSQLEELAKNAKKY